MQLHERFVDFRATGIFVSTVLNHHKFPKKTTHFKILVFGLYRLRNEGRNKAHYEVIAEFSRPTECFPPWMLGRLLVTRAPSCLHCLQLYIVSHHLLWSKFHQGAILVLKCLHYNVVSKLHVAHSNQTHDPELYKGVQMWPEQGLEKPYCICEKWNKEKPEFCNFSHSFPRTRQQWGHWFQEQLMNIFKLLIYRNCTDASIHSARILTI